MRSSGQHKGLGFLSRKAKSNNKNKESALDATTEIFISHLVKREFDEAKAIPVTQDLVLATSSIINDNGHVFKDIPLFKYVLWIGDMKGIDLFINGCEYHDPAEQLETLQKLKDIFKRYKKSGVTLEANGDILKGQKSAAHEGNANLKIIEDSLDAGIKTAKARILQRNLNYCSPKQSF